VIINYHQNREAAQKVLDEVQGAGGGGTLFQADVTRKDQVGSMIQAVRRSIPLTFLSCGQLQQLPWDDFRRAIEHERLAFYNAFRLACRI
jgi:hypothetical protein